ncbi:Ppx/GppA family phosphatase [Shewanella sp. WXL01]|uniref:Ppx/GppA phosphatase family protein n=1 Tax=Shewanella sp. WXL01 TaxID=2709721 RepID=UPI0014383DA3|nr:Ppx/GppA phosphatase family protein [Shewanella sp. WXL01]NKF50479.1 Ppx/GppA family phosphatase [Shewanella sp. WXL01]
MSDTSQHFVAIDMGSNSFHLVIAREQDGLLQILHKEKRQVQLAKFLDSQSLLAEEAIKNGVQCLKEFSQRFSELAKTRVKLVATHTLREAKNRQVFIKAARKALDYPIDVVSGHEEARLIYNGIAHSQVLQSSNIVIDIGGGSTEVILGSEQKATHLASLKCGCVSYNKRFFTTGAITKEAFKQAVKAADKQFSNLGPVYFNQDWSLVLGSSGTAKAISSAINDIVDNPDGITYHNLKALKAYLIECGHINTLNLPSLDDKRLPLIAAGLAIMIGFFRRLNIQQLQVAKGALREGVLYELARIEHQDDIRQRTITSFSQLYHTDTAQARQVQDTALALFEQICDKWQLSDYHWMLSGACQLHEIGISINSKSHHKHGRYILDNADLPGFNQQQQQMLALLVGCHRKKIDYPALIFGDNQQRLIFTRLLTILRLAVLLNLGRSPDKDYAVKLNASANELSFKFTKEHNKQDQLLMQDLMSEQQKLAPLGVHLLL